MSLRGAVAGILGRVDLRQQPSPQAPVLAEKIAAAVKRWEAAKYERESAQGMLDYYRRQIAAREADILKAQGEESAALAELEAFGGMRAPGAERP